MSVFAELHDGRRLEFPDGTDPTVIQRTVKRMLGVDDPAQAAQRGAQETAKETGTAESIAIGAGRTLDRWAAGLRQAVPEPIRNAVDKAGAAMGMAEPPSIDPRQVAQDSAAYAELEKQNPKATFVGSALPSLATVNPVAMGVMGSMEYGTPAERALRGATSYGAGKLGEFVGGKISGALANSSNSKAANLAVEKSQNSVRDATLKGAQDAGYVFPPSQVNPTVANRVAEGFAGKLTTAQNASFKNQSTTNRIFRQELGIPDELPLTKEALIGVRSAASAKGYEPIKQFGTIQADKEYAKALENIAGKYDASHGGMASLRNPEVEQLLSDASKTQLSSENIVSFLRNLREQGFANKGIGAKAKEKQLGDTQIKIANALEDLLESNLKQAGQPELLQNFRAARRLIAKSFTAEKALNESTGNIDAAKVGAMFTKGKPLDAGMKTVGKTAAAFPAAMKEVKTSLPQMSPLDWASSIIAGGATGGNLAAMAAPFARPVVRAGILSQPYQKAMVTAPKYEQAMIDKLLASAGKHPEEMQKLGGLLGLFGLQSSR